MVKMGIGRTAEVYRDDDGSAVKLFYSWVPVQQAAQEAAITETVSRLCKYAPLFIGQCHVEGRFGLRFEFIGGDMASGYMHSHLNQFIKVARNIGSLHREIHSLHAPGLRSTADVFSAGLLAYTELTPAVRDNLLEFVNAQEGDSLCHGDFHPENILIDQDGQMRVIDWANAYSGCPLADAARTYYLLRYGLSPQKKTMLERIVESFAKPMVANSYLGAYFKGKKDYKKDFEKWSLVILINRLRDRIPEEEPFIRKSIAKRLKRQFREAT